MKRTLGLLALLALPACAGNGPPATPPPAAPPAGSRTLVWADEFDRPGPPDPTKWDYEEGLVRNNEAQYYTRGRLENARVEDGRLVIEARKERFGPAEYTSASLTTRNRGHFLYGRVEVRAQLPRGRGMWPAIWMLGVDIDEVGWPRCGEIDIMENVGFEPEKIHGTIHTDAYNHVKGTHKGGVVDVPGVYGSFHLYAVEWERDRIDFFVDERPYFAFRKEGGDPAVWPFDRPQYLILNVAVGGSWGGQQGIDDGIFPQRMLVDYVRVYRRP
jgi:beta-glucanase (GH16 family)